MSWDIGEDVPLTATFADADTVLYDPDTVTFEFKHPVTGVATVFTWTASVPGVNIVKLSVGTFRVHFRPTVKGFWHWLWKGVRVDPALIRIIESDETTAIEVRSTQFV